LFISFISSLITWIPLVSTVRLSHFHLDYLSLPPLVLSNCAKAATDNFSSSNAGARGELRNVG